MTTPTRPRNLAITRAIWAAVTAHPHASLRAIMQTTGITSTSVVADHLDFLQSAGCLQQAYGAEGTAIPAGRRVLMPFSADPREVSSPPLYAPSASDETNDRLWRIIEEQPGLTITALRRRIGLSVSGLYYHLRKLRAMGRIAEGTPIRAVIVKETSW